jgi:hypothetical protein
MTSLLYKIGRFFYRSFGLSANQRIKRVYEGTLLDANLSNKYLTELILSRKAALISRLGSPEAQCVMNYLEIELTESKNWFRRLHATFMGAHNQWSHHVKTNLTELVGFFPATDEMLRRFAISYIDKLKQIDAIGIWGFVPGEEFLVHTYCSNAVKYDPRALEPYFFDNPWSTVLKNKKVLVVHPFEDSIRSQYNRRELLFTNPNVLPEFELITIKAVQSIAGNKTPYDNWFEALQSMIQLIDEKEFDIALIGAGSYGLPLAAHIKQKGKLAIHIGGALQILFGIKGKRWDDHPEISKLYNEYWVRPGPSEIVERAKVVEDGCYW